MTDKTCETCIWWQDEVCCNSDSEWVADFREAEDECEEWEGKRDETP